MEFLRTVYPATGAEVEIRYKDDGRLSIIGTSPVSHGQIYNSLIHMEPAVDSGFTYRKLKGLCKIWKRWHLNDMRAGTPKQERAAARFRKTGSFDYKEVCEYLKSIGLYEDEGYKYGSSWLKEEVPVKVIKWLFSLPGSGSSFEDIFPPEIGEKEFLSIAFA